MYDAVDITDEGEQPVFENNKLFYLYFVVFIGLIKGNAYMLYDSFSNVYVIFL